MIKCLLTGLFMVLAAFAAQAEVIDGSRIMNQGMAENLCVLTFDDGPSRYTPQLLDMLKSYGIRANFFLLGMNIAGQKDIVRRMHAEGHEIGNHSWSHPNLRRLSRENQEKQLADTDALIRSLGIVPFYMRPPYGSFDARTIHIAQDLGLDIILWSLDSKDWKFLPQDYAKLVSTRGTIYEDGALQGVFLFHDTHKSTVDDLPRIIAHLKAGGCDRFVTVSEYLAAAKDPEPPLLMTRRPVQQEAPQLALAESTAPVAAPMPPPPAYPAGTGPISMSRCSRPWKYEDAQDPLPMEAAHASAVSLTGGI